MNSSVTEGLNKMDFLYFDDFLTIIHKNGLEMYTHILPKDRKKKHALRLHIVNALHFQLLLLALRDGRIVCQPGNFEV